MRRVNSTFFEVVYHSLRAVSTAQLATGHQQDAFVLARRMSEGRISCETTSLWFGTSLHNVSNVSEISVRRPSSICLICYRRKASKSIQKQSSMFQAVQLCMSPCSDKLSQILQKAKSSRCWPIWCITLRADPDTLGRLSITAEEIRKFDLCPRCQSEDSRKI